MKIQPFTKDPSFPFLLIDGFYDEREEELIWRELEFYSGKYIHTDRDRTGKPAKDDKGSSLTSSHRIYLDRVYHQEFRHFSNILTVYGKITNEEVLQAAKDNLPTFPILEMSNRDLSQISYYDSGDFYCQHCDTFGFTVLVWFFKQPKRFVGGDFILSGPNATVECKHNRLVMIPSHYFHGVTPITMAEEYKNKGLGRYTLTHFYYNTNTPRE